MIKTDLTINDAILGSCVAGIGWVIKYVRSKADRSDVDRALADIKQLLQSTEETLQTKLDSKAEVSALESHQILTTHILETIKQSIDSLNARSDKMSEYLHQISNCMSKARQEDKTSDLLAIAAQIASILQNKEKDDRLQIIIDHLQKNGN